MWRKKEGKKKKGEGRKCEKKKKKEEEIEKGRVGGEKGKRERIGDGNREWGRRYARRRGGEEKK